MTNTKVGMSSRFRDPEAGLANFFSAVHKFSQNVSTQIPLFLHRGCSVLLGEFIPHCRVTNSQLRPAPHFSTASCGIPLTVKHILVECANLRDIREKYFTVSSLADLFNRFDNHTVIDFIKETHFYHQL